MGNLQQPNKQKKPKLLIFLITSLAILGILAILVIVFGPGVVEKQATQKPTNTGTFVTREITQNTSPNTETQPLEQTPDLNQRLQVAVQNQQRTAPVNTNTSQANTPQENAIVEIPVEQNTSADAPQGIESTQPLSVGDNDVKNGVQNPDTSYSSSEETTRQKAPAAAPAVKTPASNKDFQFKISQNEISNMIYNGLVGGTAPAYRQSIQGVSTTISGGRAKITVALEPKHLPDAFLNRLPGITRKTPTVYLGGEMGLRVSGNNVEPQIHKVSLGNMGVPMPFIENAVRAQVQAYVKNAMRLPNGQKAQLEQVQLENGAVQLKGRLN